MAADFIAGPRTKDKQGRFCKKKRLHRSTIVSNVLTEKWSAYRSLNLVCSEKKTDFSETFSLPGRQVVELGVLAKSLDEGCKT